MRVRIIRPWRLSDFPFASLAVGKVFRVRSSLAAYLFAMHCAEPVRTRLAAPRLAWKTRTSRRRRKAAACGSTERSRFWPILGEQSIAEARLRIAGKWHRLRVELDAAVMAQCSFYSDGSHGARA